MSTKKTTYGSRVREALATGLVPAKASIEVRPGEVVRILRDKHGLTQLELAELAGLSQATISSIENERVSLGVERAKSLARALRVHPGGDPFPLLGHRRRCLSKPRRVSETLAS